jgi:hypothetical protein
MYTYPMTFTNQRRREVYAFWAILLILFFTGGYFYHESKEKEQVNTLSQDEANMDMEDLFESMNRDLFATITEKDFVDYAQHVIESRCPFYRPDGTTYRTCLSDWEQDLESKVLVEQADEVHAYCSTFTNKYADESSLEGQELFLKCAIFKLR